jgi:hypothetical protein
MEKCFTMTAKHESIFTSVTAENKSVMLSTLSGSDIRVWVRMVKENQLAASRRKLQHRREIRL